MTVSNKKIAAGFAVAKQYLWDGESPQTIVYLPKHICIALDAARNNTKITIGVRDACKEIIANRLEGKNTFQDWLEFKGVKITEGDEAKMQAHRHAWLDLLIKEFSE